MKLKIVVGYCIMKLDSIGNSSLRNEETTEIMIVPEINGESEERMKPCAKSHFMMLESTGLRIRRRKCMVRKEC